jgi:5-methyltetrahydropteroyltriglutamate--homocysteine methyltransferase
VDAGNAEQVSHGGFARRSGCSTGGYPARIASKAEGGSARHQLEVALKVKAQTYSFEAANVRHEHEMSVWKAILMPGVISHATNIVEHPELVGADFSIGAAIVGRENFVGGADCSMGGRAHPEIGWAKLAALAEGAALATKTLWH